MLAPTITNNMNQIKTLCEQHRVKELYVFGSAVTDKFNEKSDVDLIVKFESSVLVESYADLYFDLADALEKLFKRKVDLMILNPIPNRFLRENIESTKQLVYAA